MTTEPQFDRASGILIDESLEILKAFKEGKEIWRHCLDGISAFAEYQINDVEVLLFWLSKQPDSLYIKEKPKVKTIKYTVEIEMPSGDYVSAGYLKDLIEEDINVEDPKRYKVKVVMEE